MNPRHQLHMSGTEGSFIVRVEGLEPPWIAPPDPKSGMSTNFTTPAKRSANVVKNTGMRSSLSCRPQNCFIQLRVSIIALNIEL